MKLVKIGREKNCTIVLPSPKVSALHAEILINDNGEYFIEDKNSLNGTFIGGEKIKPNELIKISRGDLIKFADVELNWAYVSSPEKIGDFKEVFNIGTHCFNDIQVVGAFVSKFHSMLKITKNGKAFIRDVGSTNGTILNGEKIKSNKDYRITRKDSIILGDTDITSEIAQFLPNPWSWARYVVAACIVLGLGIGITKIIGNGPIDPLQYRPAVVYVNASYHYNAILDDNPIPEVWNGVIQRTANMPYQATAFFIDKEGRMATNKHVTEPWAYRSQDETNEIKQYVAEELEKMLPVSEVRSAKDLKKLLNSELGKVLIGYSFAKKEGASDGEKLSMLNTLVKRLKSSPITINGEIDYIRVGYPGKYYQDASKFELCHVVKSSENDEIDIALLRLDEKETPASITRVFDVESFREDQLVPLKETFCTIGYPNGVRWAMDENIKSLEPEIRELKCGKIPSKYSFEFQGEAVGGASGSPVFDKKGRLVGIIHARSEGAATFGHACPAKYLKELYKNEVGL